MIKKRMGICAVAATVLLAPVLATGCSALGDGSLDAPVPTAVGNIYSWESVDGANKYVITSGDKTITTAETAFRISNYGDGGKITVTAICEKNGKVTAQSEPAVIEHTAIVEGGANYKRYEVTGNGDVFVPLAVEKAVIVGDGTSVSGDIIIENRNKPLLIELYDVNCDMIFVESGSVPRPEECVIIRSCGSVGSSFYGRTGEDGARGEKGAGLAGVGGKGGDGGTGKTGGKFNYVVFEGESDITFRGGFGGAGGDGGLPDWYNSKGGDGGDGGTGGCGLEVERSYVCMSSAKLHCVAGRGGDGGEGGEGNFIGLFPDNGEAGARGASGTEFRGERVDTDFLTVAIAEEVKTPDTPNGGDTETPDDMSAVGTYKFHSLQDEGESYFIGDTYHDVLLSEDTFKTVIYADGTFYMRIYDEDSPRGVWETGGSLIVFTIGDSVTKGKLDGDDLTLYLYDGVTLALKKSA